MPKAESVKNTESVVTQSATVYVSADSICTVKFYTFDMLVFCSFLGKAAAESVCACAYLLAMQPNQ